MELDTDNLKYVVNNWHIFPNGIIYPTSKNKFTLDNSKNIFLFSIHRNPDPLVKKLDTRIANFRVYICYSKALTEHLGYIFIPSLIPNSILRHTPISLIATNPNATFEAVENSSKENLFKTDSIEIFSLPSCGVEVITIIGQKLGVYVNFNQEKNLEK